MAGKGDKPRPIKVDRKVYESNWDRIFAKPCPQCGMKGSHKMDCTQPWQGKNK